MNDEKLGFEDDVMLGVPARGVRAVLQAISSHLAQGLASQPVSF